MTSVAIRDSSNVVPSLGNLDAYIRATSKYPILTLERERELGILHRDTGDVEAAHELVMSHLRLVVAIARQLLGYNLPMGDLIQEGNIGLMKAVKKFDPDKSTARLNTWALPWIKNSIHEYIIRNARAVKLTTTKGHRKLFWNLNSFNAEGKLSLSDTQVTEISEKLNVRPDEVREMEVRMRGRDVQIDPDVDDDREFSMNSPITWLQAESADPISKLEQQHSDWLLNDGVNEALSVLNDRELEIIKARWFCEDEARPTLHQLGDKFGISHERIRQIESAAMKKMKKYLQ